MKMLPIGTSGLLNDASIYIKLLMTYMQILSVIWDYNL